MSEKRFTTDYSDFIQNDKTFIKRGNERLTYKEIVDLLNEQQDQINYWKNKAMTLLMQVRRLTSRMTDKEVKEFSKELEE